MNIFPQLFELEGIWRFTLWGIFFPILTITKSFFYPVQFDSTVFLVGLLIDGPQADQIPQDLADSALGLFLASLFEGI